LTAPGAGLFDATNVLRRCETEMGGVRLPKAAR